MKWTRNLKISNLGSFKARLNISEKTLKYTKITETMCPVTINIYTAVLHMDRCPLDITLFIS